MTARPAILYESRLKDAAPVASSTAAGDFDVLNLRDFRDFTWWKPGAMPATVTVDCGAAAAVDYWLVWGHDLGSQGATIELRKSNDNFAADDNLVDSLTPTGDGPFARFVTTADEQYWRLRVTGASAPSLAIVAFGALLELPEWLEDGFDPLRREPRGQVNRAVEGAAIGRSTDYELWSQDLEFRRISQSWLRSTFMPAWDAHLRDDPFVFAWERDGEPDEIYLAVVPEGLDAPHHSGGKADLRFRMEAAV